MPSLRAGSRRLLLVACAFVLLVPAWVLAEHSAHTRATASGCHGNTITVFNGQTGKTVCFNAAQLSAEQTPANGVVIYNGNRKQTRVFNSATDPAAPRRNLPPAVVGVATDQSQLQPKQPVVVGISSSASETASVRPVVVRIASSGSGTQPVVLGIASSGFQNAGHVAPVAIDMAPRVPKRPPYRRPTPSP